MTSRSLAVLVACGALLLAAQALAQTPAAAAHPRAAAAATAPGDLGPGPDPMDLLADDPLQLADAPEGPGGPPPEGGPAWGRGMRGGPGGRHPGMGSMRGMPGVMHQLDLSADQKKKLEEIHERQQRRHIQARADVAIARLDLGKLLRAEKPELSAIDAQVDKLARMRADEAKARIAAFLEARAVLTPEQLEKARTLRSQHGAPGGRRGAGRPEGGTDQ